MNRRQFLKVGGLVSVCISNIPSFAISNEKKEDSAQSRKPSKKQPEKPLSYKTIDDVIIRDFLKDFLDEVTPKSNTFKELRKEYNKKGILERYSSGHRLCLDLAFKSTYQGKEISNKDYKLLGKQLSIKQDKTSRAVSRINYLDKRIEKAFSEWSKLKTENFQRLLGASKTLQIPNQETPFTKEQKEDYVKQIHNIAYPTQKEYEKYVKAQNNANNDLYAAMKKSLNSIDALFGGREISRVRKTTNQAYLKYIERFFGVKK